MNFKIDRKYLYNRLQFSYEISEIGSINVYYSYLLFEIYEDRILIKSADRQTTLQIEITPDEENKLIIEGQGKFLLSGNKIYSLIATLPEGIIVFEKTEQNILVYPENKKEKINFEIRPRNADDYPKLHHDMPEQQFEIDHDDFLRIITNTSFAASSELRETTLFLTGIFFEVKDSFLCAVATDRNRISISKMKLDKEIVLPVAEENDLIVPSRSINFIKKILQKEQNTVIVGIKDEKIYYKMNNFLIGTNVISGKYYNYSRIIPTGKRNTARINTADLRLAVERVTSIADDKRDIVVRLIIKNNTLSLITEEQEKGTGREILEIEQSGKEKEFQIKSQFLADPLKIVETESIIIEYGDEPRDLIKIVSVPDYNTMHIAAPINISPLRRKDDYNTMHIAAPINI